MIIETADKTRMFSMSATRTALPGSQIIAFTYSEHA